jgi:hypothetical protein
MTFLANLLAERIFFEENCFGALNKAPPSGKAVQNCIGVKGFESSTSQPEPCARKLFSIPVGTAESNILGK